MATNLAQADDETYAMLDEILRTYHPELEMGNSGEWPTIAIMMAVNEDPDEAPLKINGDPCAAIISVVSYKQRVDNRRDAELLIDAKIWNDLNEAQRRALLDHEATHLQVQFDKDGIIKTDDCGRPKLKMRLHDWTCTGFRSVAKRHGENALEVIQARAFVKKFGADVLAKEELFPQYDRRSDADEKIMHDPTYG
jgi:Putative phage metallopeptidase